MNHEMFIVKNGEKYHGPFRSYETSSFASQHEGEAEVIPLWVPSLPDEEQGDLKLEVLESEGYRVYADAFKVDTHHMLAGISQEFYFSRREQRVLTAGEMIVLSEDLFKVSRAVESLMHYVEKVIADPRVENLDALRKAFWRNRASDDVDPLYEDRSW
jgi:hypothetical protein